jgi:hypothetical protein
VDRGQARQSIDELADRPSPHSATALYYAVLCGLCGPAKYLISMHGQDVNAKCGSHGSPLRAAAERGVSMLCLYYLIMRLT